MKNLLLTAALMLSTTALADVPPPDTQGCSGKAAGAACQTDANKAGACESRTCSKLDYSDGSPPGTITYACLVCAEGAAVADAGPGPSPADAGTSGTGGKADTKSGCTVGFGLALPAAALLLGLRRRRS